MDLQFRAVIATLAAAVREHIHMAKQRPLPLLVIFTAYFLTAQIGHHLYFHAGSAPTIIWAPIGIALAAVILKGPYVWPAIALGALASGIFNGLPPFIIAASVIGNTLQPLAGHYFLKRVGFDFRLARAHDMFALVTVCLVITMIVPTINTFAAFLYNVLFDADRSLSWVTRWVISALSALALTPFLIRWIPYKLPKRTRSEYVEIIASTTALVITSYFLFATPYSSVGGFSLVFVLLGILFWIAFRIGPRFTTLNLLLMTLISFMGTVYGSYTPAASGLEGRLWAVQIFDLLVIGFFYILVSIEEQRKEAVKNMAQYTEDLQEAMEQVQEADEAKNTFIAAIAHELRNPLATILTSAELAEHERTQAGRAEVLQHIKERVETMNRLLGDLLDVSRMAEGKFELQKSPCDFQTIAKRAVDTVRPAITERRHTLEVDFPETSATLVADPVRLEQVFINLLSNAAKYTPPKGTIVFSASVEGTHLVARVVDNGIGIPPDLHEQIFEPFVQARASETASGIGIGLAITKQLVAMHRGSIEVFSDGKSGTEFVVRLPLSLAAAPKAREHAPAETTNRTLSILLVDDNTSIIAGFEKLLTYEGHHVALAATGTEALRLAAAMDPDIMVIDIGLPDMTGHELARTLRRRGTRAALIALSGYGQTKDKEAAAKAGFFTHLTKPISFAELLAVFDRLPIERRKK